MLSLFQWLSCMPFCGNGACFITKTFGLCAGMHAGHSPVDGFFLGSTGFAPGRDAGGPPLPLAAQAARPEHAQFLLTWPFFTL
jgi:hypothetical protein